jgi:hypothetical protein
MQHVDMTNPPMLLLLLLLLLLLPAGSWVLVGRRRHQL